MIYYYRCLFVKMKVFNYSELHFAEVTFYKIHTLVGIVKNIFISVVFRLYSFSVSYTTSAIDRNLFPSKNC